MSADTLTMKAVLPDVDLKCPPMPQTLLEAIDLSSCADGPDLEATIAMVQKDPIVVARLLRIVNSAFHAQRGQIATVRRAVVILGASTVIGMVMSMCLAELRAALDGFTAVPFMNFIRHSIATSFIGQRLVQRDPGEQPETRAEDGSEVFTAALLHDIGKLVLLYNYPQRGALVYSATDEKINRLEAEQMRLGLNHVDAGVFLTQKLNLPLSITNAIRFHHDAHAAEEATRDQRQVVGLVAAANLVANASGFAFDDPMDAEQCWMDPLWDSLLRTGVLGYASISSIRDEVTLAMGDLSVYVDAVT